MRLGKLKVSTSQEGNGKHMLLDPDLSLSPGDIDGGRHLHLVIYDDIHENTVLSCARLRSVKPKVLRSNINASGMKGSIVMFRQTNFEPTWINFNLTDIHHNDGEMLAYKIHELPPRADLLLDASYCELHSTGGVYDPLELLKNEEYSSIGKDCFTWIGTHQNFLSCFSVRYI